MATTSQAVPTVGAALQYTEAQLGGPLNEYDSTTSVSTSPVQLVPLNPDRVGLIIINAGAADVFVSFNPNVSATSGVRLSASGGSATLTLVDDFTLCARQWNAICPSGGPVNVYCIEYARYRYTDTSYSAVQAGG